MQKVAWKQAPKNIEFNSSEPKKLSKRGPKITYKSLKIWVRTHTCPSCCSHGPPECPQANKMTPRVVEWRHQADQMKVLDTQNSNIRVQSNNYK